MKKLGAIILALGFIALFAGCKTDVDVVELTKIEVTQKPSKTEYFVGEKLDLTGLEVTAKYSDGTTADVTKKVEISGFDSDEATKSQIVTVTYGGKSATFTVKIKAVELTDIAITTQPTKKEYFVGETLDLTGLKVTATYNNGTTADVTTSVTASGFDSSAAAESQTVTVTYGGKTATFTVKIIAVEVTKIELESEPAKKEYFAGEELNLAGLKVKATYNNGKTEDVTDEVEASGFDSSAAADSQTVTVTYGGKTATFTVKIIAVEVAKIELTSEPAKKEYFIGEALNLAGIKVTATYNNNKTEDVTAKVTTDYDSSTAAESKTVTVTYGGKTATFTVKIKAIELTGIAVTTQPAQKEYCIDEALDKTGLKVTATYNNGTTADVTSLVELSGFNSSAAVDSQTVTVTYSGKTAIFTVTIKDMKKMTVKEFITALGTAVETITYDTTKPAGVTLSTDGKTASVYNVKLSGAFGNSTGYIFPTTLVIADYKFPTTLVTADLRGLDTSSVTKMNCMFYDCSSLTSLDLSSFDTSMVTDMSWMFCGCISLTSLDLSSFDTSMVTDMSWMFCSCTSLTGLDVSRFDTSKVTNMGVMFGDCTSLKSLDLSSFDTSKVTAMGCIFENCSSLTSLDLSRFNTSKVTDMGYMFSGCSKLTSLDVSNFDTSSVKNMSYMFSSCTSLTGLDISNFDTSKVTKMFGMFNNCTSLTSLDLSSFDTSSVTYMDGMFSECSKLTSLDVSSFNTSFVTVKENMFLSCGTAETPLAVTYGSGWKLGTEATLLGATNLSFTLKQ